jgi:hypothetical protein
LNSKYASLQLEIFVIFDYSLKYVCLNYLKRGDKEGSNVAIFNNVVHWYWKGSFGEKKQIFTERNGVVACSGTNDQLLRIKVNHFCDAHTSS